MTVKKQSTVYSSKVEEHDHQYEEVIQETDKTKDSYTKAFKICHWNLNVTPTWYC